MKGELTALPFFMPKNKAVKKAVKMERGRKKIITPEIAEEMRELRLQGWTVKELAEKYNCCTSVIDNAIKEYRLPLSVKINTEERICEVCGKTYTLKAMNQVCCSIACLRKKKPTTVDESAIIRQITDKLPGFEYAGNYTGSNGAVDLKCKKCGATIRRNCSKVRRGTVECNVCAESERFEIEQIKEKLRTDKLIERMFNKRKLDIQNGVLRIATSKRVCAYCGESFRGNSVYCSADCSKKCQNEKHDRRRRAREHNAQVDPDITLAEVYNRDNGVCYLCGDGCKWDDYTERSGVRITGRLYPSIDHIVPLSKGGKHSWDNVRLAHHWCNAKKGTNLIPAM